MASVLHLHFMTTLSFLPLILIVEDDEDDIDFFRYALSDVSPNSKLHIAKSCEDALGHLFSEAQQKPDVIFIDLMMYGIHGIECIKKIKQNPALRYIPVVAISSAVPFDLNPLYELGVSYFITKPTTFEKLKRVIDKMVNTPNIYQNIPKANFHMQDFV